MLRLSTNTKKALAVSSAGAYVTAVYFAYQFIRSPVLDSKNDNTSSPHDNHQTQKNVNPNDNHSTKNRNVKSPSCFCHTRDPKRTQTFQKIAKAYDDQIERDEFVMGLPLLRRALLYFHAKGDILEVGAGTGRNIDFYPSHVNRVVLTDTSDQMLLNARQKLKSKSSAPDSSKFQVFVADASSITSYYPENSFDTVVDTFGVCSFDDPVEVLKELQRICKPDGKILLLEHGRTKRWEGLTNYLDKHAETHARNWGCVWNRDIDSILKEAGLVIDTLDTWHFGTTYYVVCRPGDKKMLRRVDKMERGSQTKENEEDHYISSKKVGGFRKKFKWSS